MPTFSLTQAVYLLIFPYLASSLHTPVPRATLCNGYAELCDRSYANISFVGAHDSYAVGSTNLAANQDYDVTQQLKDGIRMLQNQAHSTTNSDGIHLCHTDCLLFDGGSLLAYLQKVKSWMDANVNDVVSILIVNINNLPASDFGSVFQSAGLANLAFVPSSPTLTASQWPTLGSMIDSGKRLVVFLDNGATDSTFPYLIPEFGNIWETAFDVTDPTFSCAVNRSQGDTSQQMGLINHFLDSNQPLIASAETLAPAKGQLNVTNAVGGPGSLGQQVADCTNQNTRPPSFLLVDFYNYGEGSVFQVAASANGLPAPSNKIAPPIINGTSTSSTSSASGDWRGTIMVGIGMGLLTSFYGI